jgi:uncharacterized protein with HEPN domain
MQTEERDIALLWDMQKAAQEIVDFTRNTTFEEFAENKVLRYAVERLLLVIGEAANHISEGFRTSHPEIHWAGIIGQRNVLAHEYGEILVERIWLAASERIPELVDLLNPLIPKDSG